MFETIISKLSHFVRTTIRAVGAAVRKAPWVAPVAVLVLFVIA